ncbi:Eukaryotic translation initiation factor 3 subunit D, partial [Cryomyces minteri]
MAPMSLQDLVASLPTGETWGPAASEEKTLNGVPYAPFSKGDKLGRMADWTAEGRDKERGGRQQYTRNYRDQIYGAGTQTGFEIQQTEENTFSLVDNTRTTKTRGFGRGGGTVFRGRGQRGAQTQRGGRGTFQRVGGRGGQQGYDSRGGRGGGRGGRRFGWKDYDKPQRNRDASVVAKPDWKLLEEIDFARLMKLNLETSEGEDIDNYGFLYYYDRTFDKQPGAPTSQRKLNIIERAAYNVTTSDDPVIQELAEKDEATIFATDNILSML